MWYSHILMAYHSGGFPFATLFQLASKLARMVVAALLRAGSTTFRSRRFLTISYQPKPLLPQFADGQIGTYISYPVNPNFHHGYRYLTGPVYKPHFHQLI